MNVNQTSIARAFLAGQQKKSLKRTAAPVRSHQEKVQRSSSRQFTQKIVPYEVDTCLFSKINHCIYKIFHSFFQFSYHS